MANEVVEDNKQVSVDYTGTLDDGSVFDSSEGREPLKFVVGLGHVIPGFEKAVVGMKVGEEKDIHIDSKDAYGDYDDKLMQEVPRDAVPQDLEVKEGMTLALRAPTGQVVPAKVVQVTDSIVKLDLNHPLAGQNLNFKLKVVSIEDVPEGHDCSSCPGCH
ncbi:peptidylprolyl isomerase [Candidatus Woesearchaeota archaeon]|nr:peptidylprolyl isomerase [Candidatus Woesearchaeota archaeon]